MKRSATLIAALLATGLISTTAAVGPTAQAAPGTTSLAEVLTSDGNRFDRNPGDFDIVTEAVLAVLAAKPDSAVGVLADGSVKLTAFAPTDEAFRLLLEDLTGKRVKKERKVFKKLVAAAGVDTIETVLLYHVVPGVKLGSKKVLKSDGAKVPTAAGGATVKVKIRGEHGVPSIRLADKDRDDRNPRVVLSAIDLNKDNKQIAHGIDRVLRPVDL